MLKSDFDFNADISPFYHYRFLVVRPKPTPKTYQSYFNNTETYFITYRFRVDWAQFIQHLSLYNNTIMTMV